jgi:hypothetical protein
VAEKSVQDAGAVNMNIETQIKEIETKIQQTYINLKNKDISRLYCDETIAELFREKRELISKKKKK